MSYENEEIEKDVDWEDDILANFSEGETAIIDNGQLSEKKVTILAIGENGIRVQDRHSNEYTVNVLRLSKT